MLKKILTSPWTALITLTLVIGLRMADPAFVESVRLRYFDTLVTSKATEVIGVSVVNIDESALEKYGQYPFPRNIYGSIIQDLYRRNAGLVVFNILTPDPDRMGRDLEYATALRRYPTVLPSVGSQQTRNQPRRPGSVVIGPYANQIVEYPGIIANVPAVEMAAAGIGITNTFPEIDGVVRRMPLLISSGGRLYPSLAMETLRVAAGDSTFQVKLNENGIEKMRIPKFGPVTTDSLSRVWIDWSLVPETHSLTNLPMDFDGDIVIVGVSAAGLANPVATSRGEMLPQELQASVIGTIIANQDHPAITRPDWAEGAEVITLVVLSLISLFLSRWTYVGIITSSFFLIGTVPVGHYIFNTYHMLTDATLVMGGLVVVLLHSWGVKFVSEFLQKQQIRKQFGTYLSPDLVAQLQRQPELLVLGGESRELSIMFTDVRGFTTISEHYGKDVQGLTRIMNRYMTAMTKKILENKGTLDKYIGDAQMAFWNAPLDNGQHAKDAVKTALQMMESLNEFNREITTEGVPPFGMGLGINTGTVVVGNMGSDQRFDYTCMGDSVNLASRLEGQSKPYGVGIVLGSRTAELVRDEYPVVELDKIAVKGKKEGVNIFTVLQNSKFNLQDQEIHDTMLSLYREQKFDSAIKFCHTLKGCFNGELDHYYELWEQRCEDMKKVKLPADWDGTFIANSK
jgi:adenylate cyclase